MLTYRSLSLVDSVVSEIQEISQKATDKEQRTVSLSEVVSVGLSYARTYFNLDTGPEYQVRTAEGSVHILPACVLTEADLADFLATKQITIGKTTFYLVESE